MNDEEIIDLYFARSESAIIETRAKYGGYCHTIAYRILLSNDDAEECVDDTYVKVWNAIPPERPRLFKSFLAKITRNLAINRVEYETAQKRNMPILSIMDEFYESIPEEKADECDNIALKDAINSFLSGLDKRTRVIFMRRYWYMMSISEIAHSMDMSESNVAVTLYRTRKEFKEHLLVKGVEL